MNERRRYFRIQDTVSIHYQILEGNGLKEEIYQANVGYVKYSELRNASHCIDARLDAIAEKLGRENPLVAEAITLISRRFALLELMSGDSKPEAVMQWPELEVSLSGSGIAFEATRELLEDTPLKLEVILHPESQYISTLGRVVGCRKNEDGNSFMVAVDFEGISDENREQLVQHILKRQIEQIRTHNRPDPRHSAKVARIDN